MTERPILFSGEMVRAILDGRKTMTRRVVKDCPKIDFYQKDAEACRLCDSGVWQFRSYREGHWTPNAANPNAWVCGMPCPYGGPGDRLWVRETWFDGGRGITLEVTAVRVERVQDITEADAVAEGCGPIAMANTNFSGLGHFRSVWEEIYAKRGYGWDANPWVWVVSFRRITHVTPADWTALREAEQAAKDRREAARSRQARANQHAEVHRALVLWRQMAIENAPREAGAVNLA